MNKRFFALLAVIISGGIILVGCDPGAGTNDNPAQYTVTFDTDGGSTAPGSIKAEDGKTIGSLPAVPTKNLRNFGGWFTEKNGGGAEFKADTIVTKDITVYAKWLNLFDGTWNLVSGSPEGLQIICSGDTYLLKQNTSNWKRCSFVYDETTWTETVVENFGNGQFTIGQQTVVNYTLLNNVLTITGNGISQVFNKIL
jgi:hypothetical protein